MTTGGGHEDQRPEGEPESKPAENWPPPGEYPPYPTGGGYSPPPGEYPPAGGYPPPQSPPGYGGYTPPPPPPPGGYGSYPPPPQGGYPTGGGWNPPPNYPQQNYPGGAVKLNPGNALRFAWDKFRANPAPWLVATLVQLAVGAVVELGLNRNQHSTGFGAVWNVHSLLVEVILLAFGVLWSNIVGQMALSEVDGVKANFSMFTKFKNLGAFVLAGILVGVVTLIGVWACVVPGLVIAFLGYWTTWFVLDHNQDAITAIRSSINLARAYVAPLIGIAVVFILLDVVGACLVGIGLFVTLPLTFIGTAWAFRTMTNGRVA